MRPISRLTDPLAVGMNAVTEEDHEQIQFRIDPEAGAREAAVPEGPRRERLAAVAGIAGMHVPTEAAVSAGHVPGLGHAADGRLGQHADAAVLPAVQEHLRVNGQVARGGEEPGVPGHSAQQERAGIVDLALHPVAGAALGRRARRRSSAGGR